MVTINPKNNKPIYEQIIDQIKENILKGYVKEGDSIPSIRKLAIMIGVNPNTVSKAYQELERQKLIETVQGRGTFIAGVLSMEKNEDKLPELRGKLKTLVVEMRYAGATKEEILMEVTTLFEDWK